MKRRFSGEQIVRDVELPVHRPLLSIITINYNNRDQLFQTIESVNYWRLNHRELIEYIIVDGHSDDLRSNDISHLRNISDIFIRERDKGIYDAMNKGLRAASGAYVYFLNSGDLVINLNIILAKIRIDIENAHKAVLAFRSLQTFGNVGWERPRKILLSQLKRLCAHQATVVPLDETRGIEFDVSRPISADTLWMRKCIQGASVQMFPDIVAIFRLGGVSNRATLNDQLRMYREDPSLRRLLALFLKPILLMILGYRNYFRVIYFVMYEFISDVDLYIKEHIADRSFLGKIGFSPK